MIKKNMTIELKEGLDARPVALFIQIANQYDSSIIVEYREKKVNAKSIMGMMSLGLAQGETICISADGPDEKEAIEGIKKYLSNKE